MPDSPVRLAIPSPEDITEVVRAMSVCLRGGSPFPRSRAGTATFDEWTGQSFPAMAAPHLVRVYDACVSGGFRGILTADREYASHHPAGAGRHHGFASSSATGGPRSLSRFSAAVERGETPGHFHTFLALQAASFQVGVIPMLQAALFAEWSAGRSSTPLPDAIDEFLRDSVELFGVIPAILRRHELPRPAAAGQ